MSDCIINNERPLDKDGYPKVKFDKKPQSVARLILTLIYGREAMKGKVACHTCGNRSCVNPNHLYIGTYQDNSDDKYKDGTMCSGTKSGGYRTDVSNSDIWRMYHDEGFSQQDIGEILGIAQSSVSGRISRMKSRGIKCDER